MPCSLCVISLLTINNICKLLLCRCQTRAENSNWHRQLCNLTKSTHSAYGLQRGMSLLSANPSWVLELFVYQGIITSANLTLPLIAWLTYDTIFCTLVASYPTLRWDLKHEWLSIPTSLTGGLVIIAIAYTIFLNNVPFIQASSNQKPHNPSCKHPPPAWTMSRPQQQQLVLKTNLHIPACLQETTLSFLASPHIWGITCAMQPSTTTRPWVWTKQSPWQSLCLTDSITPHTWV